MIDWEAIDRQRGDTSHWPSLLPGPDPIEIKRQRVRERLFRRVDASIARRKRTTALAARRLRSHSQGPG